MQTTSNELSDDDDERDFEDIINLSDDKYCPQALEKMISLVALLVEKSRVDHKNLHLSDKDTHALLGGRVGFQSFSGLTRRSDMYDTLYFNTRCCFIFRDCHFCITKSEMPST